MEIFVIDRDYQMNLCISMVMIIISAMLSLVSLIPYFEEFGLPNFDVSLMVLGSLVKIFFGPRVQFVQP